MTITKLHDVHDVMSASWRFHTKDCWNYVTDQGRCLGQLVKSSFSWLVYVHYDDKTVKIASHWDLEIAKKQVEEFWKDLI